MNKLLEENQDLQKIKQKAQSQAIRIALINKVSNNIRESLELSQIIKSALKELAIMFSAFKAYYAKAEGNNFIIEETNTEITLILLIQKKLRYLMFCWNT